MIFSLFRNRIAKTTMDELELAEMSLGVRLVDTYRRLSKRNRAVFLKHVEKYNKAHSEYLEMSGKYD